MSDSPLPPRTDAVEDEKPSQQPIDRISRHAIIALVVSSLIGLGGTGYYFLYQKEKIASLRRQEASPLAYFDARQKEVTQEDVSTDSPDAEPTATEIPLPPAFEEQPVSAGENLPAQTEASDASTSVDSGALPASVLDRMAAQQQRIDEMEARIEALTQEVETLKETPSRSSDGNALVSDQNEQLTLLKQFYRTRQQALSARPFSEPLAALLAMEGLDGETYTALGKLQGVAENGLASPARLKKEFTRAFDDYLSRTRSHASSEGLWPEIKARMSGLVQIRKVGAQHKDDDDASILARAEAAVAEENITLAVSELSLLSPDAAPYFHEWRQQARQRLRTLASFERLEHQLVRER